MSPTPINIEPSDEAHAHTIWGDNDGGSAGLYIHPVREAGVTWQFGVVLVKRRTDDGDIVLTPTGDGAGFTETDLIRLRERIDELLELRRQIAEFGP